MPSTKGRSAVAAPEERAGDEALLAWFKTPTEERQAENEADAKLLRQLGVVTRNRYSERLLKLLLPPTRKETRADYKQAERDLVGWQSIGFDADDVEPWLRAGAEPGDFNLVAELVAEGVGPGRAGKQFQHLRTGERVTILEVARDFYRFYRTSNYRTLCEALDDAGVERVRGVRPSPLIRRRPGA